MEGDARNGCQPLDPSTRDPAPGLDAQTKTLGATERDEQARAAYRARVQRRAADDFVIVDECGSNLTLTPRYARASRGERAYGQVPRNTKANTSLIASLSRAGIGPAMTLQGATDTAAFEVYVEQVLGPSLVPGKIVVMDNLSAHKSRRVRELLEARGCELWYLPAYSPALSPIEEAFSKLKSLLRRAAARTQETLERAIATALDMITAQDAQGYFVHCGYGIQLGEAQ